MTKSEIQSARRLLSALIAAGANTDEPMQNAWVQATALEAAGLDGDDLDGALTAAGEQGWIDQGPRLGTTKLTPAGAQAGGGFSGNG